MINKNNESIDELIEKYENSFVEEMTINDKRNERKRVKERKMKNLENVKESKKETTKVKADKANKKKTENVEAETKDEVKINGVKVEPQIHEPEKNISKTEEIKVEADGKWKDEPKTFDPADITKPMEIYKSVNFVSEEDNFKKALDKFKEEFLKELHIDKFCDWLEKQLDLMEERIYKGLHDDLYKIKNNTYKINYVEKKQNEILHLLNHDSKPDDEKKKLIKEYCDKLKDMGFEVKKKE